MENTNNVGNTPKSSFSNPIGKHGINGRMIVQILNAKIPYCFIYPYNLLSIYFKNLH